VSGSSRIGWPPATPNPETGWHRISADYGHGDVPLARPQGHPQGLDEPASRLRLDARGVVGS
jgi:hypothetical protein